jgi:hypothetical protein
MARDDIREIIKIYTEECIGHCEQKLHKPWFDEKCSKLIKGSRLKLQWLQDPSVVNELQECKAGS